ncbi:hypothetical protein GE21DRAFT_1346798 [Neurospora crassa]|nr:hypothetical protein GE21DRAFT_1346798 [Neurospora crassa]
MRLLERHIFIWVLVGMPGFIFRQYQPQPVEPVWTAASVLDTRPAFTTQIWSVDFFRF